MILAKVELKSKTDFKSKKTINPIEFPEPFGSINFT